MWPFSVTPTIGRNMTVFRIGRSLSSLFLLAGGLIVAPAGAAQADGFDLLPISGADGVFETVQEGGVKVHRAAKDGKGAYALYLYLRVPDVLPKVKPAIYLEVTYRDVGRGRLAVQYNGDKSPYQSAEAGHGREMADRGGQRTAVCLLAN